MEIAGQELEKLGFEDHLYSEDGRARGRRPEGGIRWWQSHLLLSCMILLQDCAGESWWQRESVKTLGV
jgi:hypothetical protein